MSNRHEAFQNLKENIVKQREDCRREMDRLEREKIIVISVVFGILLIGCAIFVLLKVV